MAEDSNGDSAITDEEVTQLLPALAEAERATEATAARFVPPRPGILEEDRPDGTNSSTVGVASASPRSCTG